MPLSYEEGNILLDLYESLLTDKQKDVLNQYYRLDYSLSEIAENLDVSKSAIGDLIKRTNSQLLEYEDKLKLKEKYLKRVKLYEQYRNEYTNKLIEELINLE